MADVNIYVDMDDVLCDTAGGYLELLSREFDRRISFEDIFSFNLQKSFDLDEEQNRRLFALAHEKDFTLGLRPLPGMLDILEDWRSRGMTISIVTGRHTSAYQSSLEWLARWQVPHHSFTMVDKYQWPQTDTSIAVSLDVLTRRQFDLGVEDAPKMASYLSREMGVPVMLFDRPWNRDYVLDAQTRRCCGWQELGNMADLLATELLN